MLKTMGVVEFEGAPKTGGYVIKEGMVQDDMSTPSSESDGD